MTAEDLLLAPAWQSVLHCECWPARGKSACRENCEATKPRKQDALV